jgi:cytoskeletal protein RodZ
MGMSSNVVQIDQRALARAVSDEVRRKFYAERSVREVAAIRRNRLARLVKTKQWWWTMLGVTSIVSMSIGASALWWWQQGSIATTQLSLQVATGTTTAQIDINKSVSTTSGSGSPHFPSTQAIAPVLTQVGRMPPGTPMSPVQTAKQAVKTPAPIVRQPVPTPTQTTAATKLETQPSTQYEAPRQAITNQAAMPTISQGTTQDAAPATAVASIPVTNTAYQVLGVPVDGVLQIKIGKDPAIKPIRVGERLPNGEILRKANSETGQIETSERTFKVN